MIVDDYKIMLRWIYYDGQAGIKCCIVLSVEIVNIILIYRH